VEDGYFEHGANQALIGAETSSGLWSADLRSWIWQTTESWTM